MGSLAREHLNLAPPLVEAGRVQDFIDAGQTISSTFSPSDETLAVFVTNVVCP